jgi:prophage tail gpP-like protein
MTDPVSLIINGTSYADFKSVQLTASMEQFARDFSFQFSDKWFNTLLQENPFKEGDPATIQVYGKTFLEGFIEDIPVQYNSRARSIGVIGRSRACDLVDCSAIHKSGSWRNVSMVDIAKSLIAPYGLSVKVDPWAVALAAPPFSRWAIEDEEKVFDCIARMAKMRGLFLLSDASGDLIITKSSPLPFPYKLQFGVNIFSGSRSSHFRDRYSEYTIKGQRSGDDTFFAENVGKGFYKTTDPQVDRFRPLIIMSDSQGSAQELKSRGDHERNLRAGKSRKLAYDHVGLRTTDQKLPFILNRLIPIIDPVVDFTGSLLVSGISHRFSSPGGEITHLELSAPEMYDILIPPKPKPKKSTSLF